MSFSIFTAFPRGYCAGVHRAVGMLQEIISKYPAPIYVNHEIIHNTFVVKMFERKGVIFEPDLDAIPEGNLVVISAHGTGPSYFARLQERHMRWIDATCPLVEKVHKEARDLIEKGYHILYIGKKGHQEALGVIDEGEKYFTLIEKDEDLDIFKANFYRLDGVGDDTLPPSPNKKKDYKLALLTQTTLSVDDTARMIEKAKSLFPHIILPKMSDICYATTNRQKAVKALAEVADLVFVVGSKKSSNSSKLCHVVESLGKRAHLVDGPEDIEETWLVGAKNVGVISGASGPEELVDAVVRSLSGYGGKYIRELRIMEENMQFPYTLRIHGDQKKEKK